MLDVHVAIIPTVKQEWIDQCLDSIKIAIENAGYPVNLYVFDGVIGHIGKSREIGYSMGNSKYMTYIDCDDYVLPNAFSCLKEAMDESPALIRTGEIALQNGHFTNIEIGKFHLMVYRRDILNDFDYESHPLRIDLETLKLAETHGDGIINIPICVYVQRMYWESGSRVLARIMRNRNN